MKLVSLCRGQKAGNATALEHKAIIKRFVDLFGKDCIAGILADREFANGHLFSWFNKEKIPFYIHIKESALVKIKGRKFKSAKRLFNHLEFKQRSAYGMTVEIFDQTIYLNGSRSERGELMIVATNQRTKNAVAIYLRRWEIETLFLCLKSRGFCFEDTHLKHLDRIEKLMALLTVGLCWAHKIGEWRAEKKPIKFWKYRDSFRPQYSYFRYGLDFIGDLLLNPYKTWTKLKRCLDSLVPVQPISEGNL